MEVLFEVVRVREAVGVGAVPEEGVADPRRVAAAAAGVPVQFATVGLEGVDVGVRGAGDDDALGGDDLGDGVGV